MNPSISVPAAQPSRAYRQLTAWLPLLALLIACGLLFWNLGGGSIDSGDESLTAGRSLSMLHDANPLRLTVNGEVSMRKPPLIYLFNAASLAGLGINELGLRLPNALFGLGVFVLIGVTARRLYGAPWAGVAMLWLVGASLFIKHARQALTDTLFVFGLTLGVVALMWALADGRLRRGHLAVFGLGLGLALFGKGLMALVLPAYAGGYYLLVLRNLRQARALLLPSLLALLPLAAWMLAASQTQPEFFQTFFLQEYLERVNYASGFLPRHILQPWWYLAKFAEWQGLAGYIALGGGLAYLWARRPGGADPLYFLTGFSLLILIALSIASHKRDTYALPLFPLFALQLTGLLYHCWQRWPQRRTVLARAAAVLLVLGLVQTAVRYHPAPDYQPADKALALALRPHVARATAIYCDSGPLARVLHFYLQRDIIQVKSLAGVSSRSAILVSLKALPGATALDKYHYLLPDVR